MVLIAAKALLSIPLCNRCLMISEGVNHTDPTMSPTMAHPMKTGSLGASCHRAKIFALSISYVPNTSMPYGICPRIAARNPVKCSCPISDSLKLTGLPTCILVFTESTGNSVPTATPRATPPANKCAFHPSAATCTPFKAPTPATPSLVAVAGFNATVAAVAVVATAPSLTIADMNSLSRSWTTSLNRMSCSSWQRTASWAACNRIFASGLKNCTAAILSRL
mmetsp:Transcript_4881/g.11730  ORF Transcript_4881/g.11730 Transcript_4881/m.11730 type:complete len:222 (-) Transcript_4881:89-754(-)